MNKLFTLTILSFLAASCQTNKVEKTPIDAETVSIKTKICDLEASILRTTVSRNVMKIDDVKPNKILVVFTMDTLTGLRDQAKSLESCEKQLKALNNLNTSLKQELCILTQNCE